MERLILDTSVLVAIERGTVSFPDLAAADAGLSIAAVTVAELFAGVERSDAAHQPSRHAIVSGFVGALAVLPYGEAEARVHAQLLAEVARSGRPRGAHDLIIAATAKVRGCTVVTLDRRGFEGLPGVEVRGA